MLIGVDVYQVDVYVQIQPVPWYEIPGIWYEIPGTRYVSGDESKMPIFRETSRLRRSRQNLF